LASPPTAWQTVIDVQETLNSAVESSSIA
jgi:hypothetical protein